MLKCCYLGANLGLTGNLFKFWEAYFTTINNYKHAHAMGLLNIYLQHMSVYVHFEMSDLAH